MLAGIDSGFLQTFRERERDRDRERATAREIERERERERESFGCAGINLTRTLLLASKIFYSESSELKGN